MKKKDKDDGLSPHNVKLATLADVREEMSRVYRSARQGKIEPETGTKYVYMLKEIRGCIEAGLLEDVQSRLAELSAKVGQRNGR